MWDGTAEGPGTSDGRRERARARAETHHVPDNDARRRVDPRGRRHECKDEIFSSVGAATLRHSFTAYHRRRPQCASPSAGSFWVSSPSPAGQAGVLSDVISTSSRLSTERKGGRALVATGVVWAATSPSRCIEVAAPEDHAQISDGETRQWPRATLCEVAGSVTSRRPNDITERSSGSSEPRVPHRRHRSISRYAFIFALPIAAVLGASGTAGADTLCVNSSGLFVPCADVTPPAAAAATTVPATHPLPSPKAAPVSPGSVVPATGVEHGAQRRSGSGGTSGGEVEWLVGLIAALLAVAGVVGTATWRRHRTGEVDPEAIPSVRPAARLRARLRSRWEALSAMRVPRRAAHTEDER